MTRSAKTLRCGIIAAIALVFRTIAKKNAHNRAQRKFRTFNRRKRHKTNTAESAQVA